MNEPLEYPSSTPRVLHLASGRQCGAPSPSTSPRASRRCSPTPAGESVPAQMRQRPRWSPRRNRGRRAFEPPQLASRGAKRYPRVLNGTAGYSRVPRVLHGTQGAARLPERLRKRRVRRAVEIFERAQRADLRPCHSEDCRGSPRVPLEYSIGRNGRMERARGGVAPSEYPRSTQTVSTGVEVPLKVRV